MGVGSGMDGGGVGVLQYEVYILHDVHIVMNI